MKATQSILAICRIDFKSRSLTWMQSCRYFSPDALTFVVWSYWPLSALRVFTWKFLVSLHSVRSNASSKLYATVVVPVLNYHRLRPLFVISHPLCFSGKKSTPEMKKKSLGKYSILIRKQPKLLTLGCTTNFSMVTGESKRRMTLLRSMKIQVETTWMV